MVPSCITTNPFYDYERSIYIGDYRTIEQYVSDVKDFSSQYGSDISISYTAYNITGKPSNFPDYGDFPQAFVMRTYGKWWDEAPSKAPTIGPQNYGKIKSQDYIDVTFEQSVVPLRVSVFETYNPGSVVRLWAWDPAGRWALLWQGPPQTLPHTPRIFSPKINRISFYTNVLRLEFDHSELGYYTELDAVLLLGGVECSEESVSLWPQLPSPDSDSSEYDSDSTESPPHITKQVIDLELTSLTPDTDISSSLQDLDNLAQHYITLLHDINKGMESCRVSTSPDFNLLPDETVLKIFSYLDLVSLCNCTKVNRQFNRLASDAMLYTQVGLRPYWNLVNNASLDCLESRCQYLHKLDFSWCGAMGTVTPQNFANFISNCGKLITHLRLDCCKFVDDIVIASVADSCRNLKELTLRNCSAITTEGFRRLSEISFERLDLYRTYIETEPLVNILKASPDLKHIVLGSCVRISVMDEVAVALGTYNRELISVDFWKTYSLTPVGVKALSQCSSLQELDLGWCLGVSIPGDCLRWLATGCPRLKKLFMVALRGISDRDLGYFITHCPLLEQVDLLGVKNISPNICYRMLRECKCLRLLDLSFCDQFSDDVVERWARQFPQVSIKKSFHPDGEVRVPRFPIRPQQAHVQ